MRGDSIKTTILSVQIIPNADPALLASLGAGEDIHSLGIITTDCDDVSYAALDEATKKAVCRVVYAKSMYAGSGNASTAYAGEFIGILGAPDPAEVKAGVSAAVSYIENDAFFVSANADASASHGKRPGSARHVPQRRPVVSCEPFDRPPLRGRSHKSLALTGDTDTAAEGAQR